MSGRGRTVEFLQDGRGRGRGGGGGGGRSKMYADREGGGRGGGNDYTFNFTSNRSRAIQRKNKNQNPFLARLDHDDDEPMGGGDGGAPRGGSSSNAAFRGRGRGGRGNKRWNRVQNQAQGRGQGQAHNFGPEWHKILVLNGSSYSRDFILNTITSLAGIPLRPFAYTTLGVNTVFFVEDRPSAEAIAGCSGNFSGPDAQKIMLKVNPYGSPPTATIDAACETRIKAALASRYDPSVPAFSLQNFHNTPEFILDYYLPLYRSSVVLKIFNLSTEVLPTLVFLDLSNNKLTSLDSFQKLAQLAPALRKLNLGDNKLRDIYLLERLRGLQLTELRLENNPLCTKFDNQEVYIRNVKKHFPKITFLDGIDAGPVIKFDLEEDEIVIPIIKPGYFCNDQMKLNVITFIEQYIKIYDSDNRNLLMDAYHDLAVFTMQSTFPKQGNSDHSTTKLSAYIGDSRNYMRTQDPEKLKRGLRTGKIDIVAFLGRLPKTTHDIHGFNVDMAISIGTLVHFTINGVFQERGGEREMALRAFHRSFNLIPMNGGYVIVNEMLFVTNATSEQTKVAFTKTAPTPSPSPVHAGPSGVPPSASLGSLSEAENQAQLTANFSRESGMNDAWSRKCLEQNLWDYNKSATVFLELQKNNQIPPEAFVK